MTSHPSSLLEVCKKSTMNFHFPVWLLRCDELELSRINTFVYREIQKHTDAVIEKIPEIPEEEAPPLLEIDQTESDAMIAQMLQTEMNQEYDLMLKRTEKKFNRDSKGWYAFFYFACLSTYFIPNMY